MRRTAAVAICLSGAFAAGCLDIEQTLTLERDLSGKAGFAMKVNMEPVVGFMARMKRGMEGKEGDPTAEELAAARQELLKSGSTFSPEDFDSEKKKLEGKLPAGITLLDAKFQQDALKVGLDFAFGFDTLSKLSRITLDGLGDQGSGSAPGNPVQNPFKGLNAVDEGETILVTGLVGNPMADALDQLPPDPETRRQIDELLGSLRIAYKVTAPFTVVESTTHRREGSTLIWEYDLKSMEQMTPAQLAQGISVRFRK